MVMSNDKSTSLSISSISSFSPDPVLLDKRILLSAASICVRVSEPARENLLMTLISPKLATMVFGEPESRGKMRMGVLTRISYRILVAC